MTPTGTMTATPTPHPGPHAAHLAQRVTQTMLAATAATPGGATIPQPLIDRFRRWRLHRHQRRHHLCGPGQFWQHDDPRPGDRGRRSADRAMPPTAPAASSMIGSAPAFQYPWAMLRCNFFPGGTWADVAHADPTPGHHVQLQGRQRRCRRGHGSGPMDEHLLPLWATISPPTDALWHQMTVYLPSADSSLTPSLVLGVDTPPWATGSPRYPR